jgi:CRISPR/Cas system CSM-associated protein Csm3 (group 7 of RAMP superfamily)
LQEECANILFSLQQESLKQDTTFTKLSEFETAADNLFGKGGSDLNTEAKMFIGDAVLQEDLRNAVKYAIENGTPKITPDEVLQSLTTIRRQTAMNEKGSPQPESLRSMRVILRETVFEAECKFDEDCEVDSNEIILLGLICASLQRIGLARNRGRGKVSVKLFGTNDLTALCMRKFEEIQ